MKAKRLVAAALAVGLGLAAISSATDVDAQGKGKKEAVTPAARGEPTKTKRTIVLLPSTVSWGMSHKQVEAAIDKALDAEYKPIYRKTSPGVKMKALDAQLAEEKSAFKRSLIELGSLPTGLDATPLKGEYTYLNKESIMLRDRERSKTYYFFIQDRLWKIIDERQLGEGSRHGKDFEEAVGKIKTLFGAQGRVLPADFDKGRPATEVDWKDSATHLRAIQRGETAYAIALEDLGTLSNLATLRANKPPEDNGIDPAVAAVTRKDDAPPGPPEKPSNKKQQQKKK